MWFYHQIVEMSLEGTFCSRSILHSRDRGLYVDKCLLHWYEEVSAAVLLDYWQHVLLSRSTTLALLLLGMPSSRGGG